MYGHAMFEYGYGYAYESSKEVYGTCREDMQKGEKPCRVI